MQTPLPKNGSRPTSIEYCPKVIARFSVSKTIFTCGDFFFRPRRGTAGYSFGRATRRGLTVDPSRVSLLDNDFGKVVVLGHTPVPSPDVRPNRINIDTGGYSNTGRRGHGFYLIVGSDGRCNTGIESRCWGFKSQCLTWPFIELTRHFIQMGLRVHRQVGSLREVLSQQTIGVLVGTALPRRSKPRC